MSGSIKASRICGIIDTKSILFIWGIRKIRDPSNGNRPQGRIGNQTDQISLVVVSIQRGMSILVGEKKGFMKEDGRRFWLAFVCSIQ